jgi:hypothetical protein
MTDEDNNPDSGIETVNTQAPDTAEDWDYYDPEEDNVEPPEEAATEEGTEEVSEPEEIEAPLEAVVMLSDGTKAKVADLVQGNLRQADYTRKSQELAVKRQAIDADIQRIEGITESFIDHLSKLVPEAPDHALALRDPSAYTRQLAQHQAAMAQVQKLIELGEQPKQIKDAMTAEQRSQHLADENSKLLERFPAVSTKAGRESFFSKAVNAANEIGFSQEELGQVDDHRLFVLAHYAKIGMESVKSREVAKAKVQAAPQVSPRKPGQTTQGNRNAEGMRKLARSGSIKDALRIDWE